MRIMTQSHRGPNRTKPTPWGRLARAHAWVCRVIAWLWPPRLLLSAEEHAQAADLFAEQEQFDRALWHLHEARRLAPTSTELMEREGWLHAHTGAHAAAYDLWKRAHEAGSDSAAFHAIHHALDTGNAQRLTEFFPLALQADLEAALLTMDDPAFEALAGHDPTIKTALKQARNWPPPVHDRPATRGRRP